MKKLMFILLLIIGSVIYAQEETIIGENEITTGGYGAPVIKFTSINSQFGVLVGARGGWILDHSITLGVGGYGLVNNVEVNGNSDERSPLLNFGYGGIDLGYIMKWHKLLHASFNFLIGGGAVGERMNFNVFGLNLNLPNLGMIKNHNFFIAEPEADFELNIVKFCRIDIGASYRFISGAKQNGLSNTDLSGVSAIMTLKFGRF